MEVISQTYWDTCDIVTMLWSAICLAIFKTRWHGVNLFQPIKGFHFLRLHPIKWALYEGDRCLYIGINVKARFSTQPPPQHPYATISLVYPLIVTLLWCFNTVLYLWSRFIYYLVLLCYIIYIQSKSYVNVYMTLKDILLKSHEIMLIFANLHLIGYINIVMICHLPHA